MRENHVERRHPDSLKRYMVAEWQLAVGLTEAPSSRVRLWARLRARLRVTVMATVRVS